MEGTPPNDIERIEAKIDKVLVLLTGNGNPASGLVVRVDRIEQRHIRRDEAAQQTGKDWRAIAFPILTQAISALVGALAAIVYTRAIP